MVFFGRRAVERMLRLRALPCAMWSAATGMRCVARSGATDVKRGDAAPSPSRIVASIGQGQRVFGHMTLGACGHPNIVRAKYGLRPGAAGRAAHGTGAHCKHTAQLLRCSARGDDVRPAAKLQKSMSRARHRRKVLRRRKCATQSPQGTCHRPSIVEARAQM